MQFSHNTELFPAFWQFITIQLGFRRLLLSFYLIIRIFNLIKLQDYEITSFEFSAIQPLGE
jgi:hypothetical protein